MAEVTYDAVLRARRLRSEAARARARSAQIRVSSHELRDRHEVLHDRVGLTLARREQIRSDERIGTWPYWAPPGPELWDVLVALPEAA